jgi:hypothetical protein
VAIQNQNFNDQAAMYRKGNLKMFYFTKKMSKNAERSYHPGE